MNKSLRQTCLAAAVILMLPAHAAVAQSDPFGDTLSLSAKDVELMRAMAFALFYEEAPEVGEIKTWFNAQTGNAGAVSLIDLFERDGMPCRRIEHRIIQKGRTDSVVYQFAQCRDSDGAWKLF